MIMVKVRVWVSVRVVVRLSIGVVTPLLRAHSRSNRLSFVVANPRLGLGLRFPLTPVMPNDMPIGMPKAADPALTLTQGS